MEETSKALQDLFYQYTHLPIGGKEISCPYWMNKLKKLIWGPLGGKGMPEQIRRITVEEAQKAGIDLSQMNETEILSFMKGHRIGIDCSGFVFWMLDALDKEKGGNGISDDIPHLPGTLAERQTSVAALTGENLAIPIEKVKDIAVGDMIRLHRGKHVAVVMQITKEDGKIKEIKYAHSSERTVIQGVHSAKIKVVDWEKGIWEQEWEETLPSGNNYGREFCRRTSGDGLKRLKIWA